MNSIFKTFVLSVLMIAQVHFAYAQNSILPPAKTTFVDQNGKPLTAGKVEFYIPGTSTLKATYQDAAGTILNTNPVVLDAAGRGLILGSGSYRQVVKDRLNNVIWDQVTASSGGGTSSGTGDGNAVGSVQQFTGFVAPSNYAFAYGQEVSRTTYAALLNTITSTQNINCTSGNPTLTNVSDTTQLNIGAKVEAACVPAGATIVSKTSNSVTISANAIVTTTGSAKFFPWGNGNGLTTFNIPDFRGVYLPGRNNMGGAASANLSIPYYSDPNAIAGGGGSQSKTLLSSNLPPYTPAGTVSTTTVSSVNANAQLQVPAQSGATVDVGGATSGGSYQQPSSFVSTSTFTGTAALFGGIAVSATVGAGGSGYTAGTQLLTISGGTCTTQPQFNVTIVAGAITAPVLATAGSCSVVPSNPAATTGGGGTGGTLNIAYSANPISAIPPSKTVNYIIKILPDVFPSATSVTSIQGMTGVIVCAGAAIDCSGGTITVNIPTSAVTSVGGMTGAIGCGSGLTCTAGAISVNNTNPYVIPSTYGAVCDGVTDDTVALQNMLTASSGKTVFFPTATCVITAHLNVPSDITITGGGRNVSIIKQTGADYIFNITNKSNVIISDIYLLGNRTYTSWTASTIGAIFLSYNTTQSNLTFSNLKLSNFNSTYWIQGSQTAGVLSNLTFDNLLIQSVIADIPTDPDPFANATHGIALFSGTAGSRYDNLTIKNSQVDGSGLCIGAILYSNYFKYTVRDNRFSNMGGVNTNSFCTNALAAVNVYGISVYDLNADGNPPQDGLIVNNYVTAPLASGIYVVGDPAHYSLLIEGNLITGQVSTDGLAIRAGISVVGAAGIDLVSNSLNNNNRGVAVSSQRSGVVTVFSNHFSSTGGGSVCLHLGAGTGAANTDRKVVRGNYFECQGTTIDQLSTTANRHGIIEISGNTIIGVGTNVNFGSAFFATQLTLSNNTIVGGTSNLAGITGTLALVNNTGLFFTAATLPATANGSSVYVTDGAPASACTGGSTGAQAFRQNGAWKCF